ncbi:pilus assembly protein TadG-related protein [Pseudomonas sp. PSE14]|uniref:pilus assembly protein TadG-related protein n=1 Tax=Pseudomonas TaxID=286 RepID=UPI0023D85932|nr:pilus assembly protein TadG-related protein [Pseudomonas sp. PSE14]WEJ73386.1 pilus assembly protein TadG-related protein [Pseudomonas sp. PSE14]
MGRERQRGAIGIMAAGTLLLALVCLALVVDTGRLYYEQRKLQRVADMAALEAAGQSGMCGSQQATEIQGYVTASAAKNGFVPATGEELTGVLGSIKLKDDAGRPLLLRGFSPGGNLADSVKVRVTHNVPSSLILNVASVFKGVSAQTQLRAEAVARRTALGALSAGSGLFDLDSSKSALLNDLLGALLRIDLDVASYNGIAGANLSLRDLATQLNLNVGTVEELVNTNVGVAELLDAAVNAVSASNTAGVDTALLGNALAGATVPITRIDLASILSVTTPSELSETALDSEVNLLDLLMATAMAANKESAVSIPTVNLSVPGVTNLTATLYVIQPPQIAIGYPGKNTDGSWRTDAKPAQVRLSLGATANLLGIVSTEINLSLRAISGHAALASIQCGGVAHSSTATIQAAASLATIENLSFNTHVLGAAKDSLASVSIAPKSGSVPAMIDIGSNSDQPLEFVVASRNDLPSEVKRISTPVGNALANGLSDIGRNLQIQVTLAPCNNFLGCLVGDVLGGLLNGLFKTVADLTTGLTAALAPILSDLGAKVLDPLLSLLGIQVGNLDVRLIDLQTQTNELLI